MTSLESRETKRYLGECRHSAAAAVAAPSSLHVHGRLHYNSFMEQLCS